MVYFPFIFRTQHLHKCCRNIKLIFLGGIFNTRPKFIPAITIFPARSSILKINLHPKQEKMVSIGRSLPRFSSSSEIHLHQSPLPSHKHKSQRKNTKKQSFFTKKTAFNYPRVSLNYPRVVLNYPRVVPNYPWVVLNYPRVVPNYRW